MCSTVRLELDSKRDTVGEEKKCPGNAMESTEHELSTLQEGFAIYLPPSQQAQERGAFSNKFWHKKPTPRR